MIKQYRINGVVEAIQYDGTNFQEILDFAEEQQKNITRFLPPFDWVIKTIYGKVLVIPNHIFIALYSEVFE